MNRNPTGPLPADVWAACVSRRHAGCRAARDTWQSLRTTCAGIRDAVDSTTWIASVSVARLLAYPDQAKPDRFRQCDVFAVSIDTDVNATVLPARYMEAAAHMAPHAKHVTVYYALTRYVNPSPTWCSDRIIEGGKAPPRYPPLADLSIAAVCPDVWLAQLQSFSIKLHDPATRHPWANAQANAWMPVNVASLDLRAAPRLQSLYAPCISVSAAQLRMPKSMQICCVDHGCECPVRAAAICLSLALTYDVYVVHACRYANTALVLKREPQRSIAYRVGLVNL